MANEGRRVRVRATEHLEEMLAAALLVARQAQRRDQHREENLLARKRPADRLALEFLQEENALLVHGIEPAREHRLEKLFLGTEVVVDRGEVHVRRGGKLPQARRVHTVVPATDFF